jgi:hypothetical protein
MLSRATLLLRLASGATAKLLRDAGINGRSIQFWWQQLGQGRGIWEGTQEVGDVPDLWADIAEVLDGIRNFQNKNKSENQTFYLAGHEIREALVGLGSCERVAIWSLVI